MTSFTEAQIQNLEKTNMIGQMCFLYSHPLFQSWRAMGHDMGISLHPAHKGVSSQKKGDVR